MLQIRTADFNSGDKSLVAEIITRSFADDPLLNWIVRQDKHRIKRIGRLVKTTVDLFMPDGVTVVEAGGNGCALWVKPAAPGLSLWQTAQVAGMLGSVAGWRRLYPRRITIVEPVFASIRTQKRLDRFTLRGKVTVNIQWLLYCMVHNIEKIFNCGQLCAVG